MPWPQLSRAPMRLNSRCRTSTRLWCGLISAETGSPLRVKLIVRVVMGLLVGKRLAGLGAQRPEHGLGSERQLGDAHAAGVLDRVGDRGRHAEGRGLAHALGAERAVRLVGGDRLALQRVRYIEDARDLVVGERGIGHLAGV